MAIATSTAPPRRASRSRNASPFYASLRLPILCGPLAGYGWIPASGGKVVRMLLGTYEREQTALFLRHVHAGDCLLDIGAAGGYYTLLSSQLVGYGGRVVAFEPDSRNANYLRQHVAVNGRKNVIIEESAVGEADGSFRFGGGNGTGTGRLCDEGNTLVRVRRLDDLCREFALAPTHLKIDVEGAEASVLRGGSQVIQKNRPIIFLSTHGPSVHAQCCEILRVWGYDLSPIVGNHVGEATEILALP